MKNRNLLGICLTILVAMVLFAALPGQAQAATSGIYEYDVEDGEAWITAVDPSASGTITLPSTLGGYPVTGVYSSSLDNCDKLTSVTIPASVEYFGNDHYGCNKLTKYIVAADNEYYSADSSGVLFDKEQTELIAVPNAISGSYTIPGTVVSIDGFSFSDCRNLTSVTIPAATIYISDYAFYSCKKLTAINVNSNNPAYSNDSSGVLFDKDKTRLLRAPHGISGSYTIPSGVVSLADAAFNSCVALTSVSVPSSLTQASLEAFWSCNKLKFNSYNSGLYLGNSSNPYHLFLDISNNEVTSCNLHADTKVIASYAGSYADNLTSVSIPSGIEAVGASAFTKCDLLKYNKYDNAVYLGNASNPYLVLIAPKSEDITSCKLHNDTQIIVDYAFISCEDLKSVTFGNKIRTIGVYAFFGSNLTSVVLPDSLTQLAEGVFSSNTKLTSVTFGSKLTTIGNGAFDYTALRTLQLPETVTSIGCDAFRSCELTSLSLPASLTHIGSGAFAHNDLTSLIIPASVTHIGEEAFNCWMLDLVRFLGNAPTVAKNAYSDPYLFPDMQMTIQIPANNSTWTSAAKAKIASDDAIWTTAKSYAVTSGANTVIEEATAVSIGTSVSASDLIGVYVDGALVRSYHYTVSGNTTVTLDEDYVAKLRNGAHAVSLIFKDGEATTTLTLKRTYNGDLDGMDGVSEDDAVYLLQHILMPDFFPVEQDVDFDGNGIVDEDDAVYLLQHVLMPDFFPL